MAKQKCPECPQCLPGWLVQFADLMSLLLVFFVLLLSMAVMDKKKVEEYISVMKKSMGFISENDDTTERKQSETDAEEDGGGSSQDDGSGADNNEAVEAIEEIVAEANAEMTSESTAEQVELIQSNNEFTLDIPSTLMFEEGEYELSNPASKKFIAKIARVIRTMPQTFEIEVVGHTDRSAYKSDTIPRDNWDVSALRSISVVKELIKNKIDPSLLKVSAFGQYRPKSDMSNENRRVEMRFIASRDQTDLLSEENFFDRLEQ